MLNNDFKCFSWCNIDQPLVLTRLSRDRAHYTIVEDPGHQEAPKSTKMVFGLHIEVVCLIFTRLLKWKRTVVGFILSLMSFSIYFCQLIISLFFFCHYLIYLFCSKRTFVHLSQCSMLHCSALYFISQKWKCIRFLVFCLLPMYGFPK